MNLDGVGVVIIFKIGYAKTTPLGGETSSFTIARRQAPTARLPPGERGVKEAIFGKMIENLDL